jgi:phosphoribosylaminoimidazolecarboxamide formyltransferase / IMP cyclohydrolase
MEVAMTTHPRALISVYDKTGVVELARRLAAAGYGLLSSGGTAGALKKAGVEVTEISAYTGHPEILGGRVKTLHPRVHGGILADPSRDAHRADLERAGIEPITLVVVNLYPFRQVAGRAGASLEELIEMIDIGGPAMVRAAAKNHRRVGVVVDSADYDSVAAELERHGALSPATRERLALKAFALTAAYDAAIHDELARRLRREDAAGAPAAAAVDFPEALELRLRRATTLRYGENPHQRAALYVDPEGGGVAGARQLQGKELSFNNLLDLDAAWRCVLEFDPPAAVVVKHNNPCGVALGSGPAPAFERARRTDPASAFGGIVAFNRVVDRDAAAALAALFLECVIAPDYQPEALRLLAEKKGLRVMRMAAESGPFRGLDLRRVTGGLLAQDWDQARTDLAASRVATRRGPTPEELRALDLAWRVAKHVKSNAIVLARPDGTVGIGAGQMSRVDAVRLARMKACEPTAGCVLASDAFFPFRDGLDEAAAAGVTAVVQPGGSVKDDDVIAAADGHGMAMVLTGVRHFRH